MFIIIKINVNIKWTVRFYVLLVKEGKHATVTIPHLWAENKPNLIWFNDERLKNIFKILVFKLYIITIIINKVFKTKYCGYIIFY